MWWLAVAVGVYMFRGQLAKRLAPFLPSMTPQQNAFYGNLVTLVAGAVYVLPIGLLGLGTVKRLAFLASLWSTIITAGLSIKANYGMPPVPQTFSIAAIKQMMGTTMQPWLQQAMLSMDFHFLFFSLIFVTANPSALPILILWRRSLWSVCTYCTKTPEAGGRAWRAFKPTWEKLKAKEPEVLQYSALAEIMLGLWLTVSLFLPTRQIITCLLYWNYLKTRYQVPRSAAQHEKAWRQLGQSVAPALKMAPFLQKPLDIAKGWFQPKYQTQTR